MESFTTTREDQQTQSSSNRAKIRTQTIEDLICRPSESRSIWTWGSNKNYLLGSGMVDSRTVPEELDFSNYSRTTHSFLSKDLLSKLFLNFKHVAISKFHVIIITDLEIFTFGYVCDNKVRIRWQVGSGT